MPPTPRSWLRHCLRRHAISGIRGPIRPSAAFLSKTASSLGAAGLSPVALRTVKPKRCSAQALRARYDAILVGSGTALADDPMLTCRLEGYAGRPKVRIVLDRRLRLPVVSQLVHTASDIPTWVVTQEVGQKAEALAAEGVDV